MIDKTNLEAQKLAVTKLELKIEAFLKENKRQMFADPIRARRRIEDMRKQYLLDQHTIAMFVSVGMASEYTTLLKKFNKVLDGDLS
jgi:hypothetical protein